MKDPITELELHQSRRAFLLNSGMGLGTAALASLFSKHALAAKSDNAIKAKAKRIIYLFMAGGPSHIDTFDYKPAMRAFHGEELPESVRQGQRLTGMTSRQASKPVTRS